MKLTLSENHNPNYVAKHVKLDNLAKHPNADKLMITVIDFQNVIVGLGAELGDEYVFIPVESKIDARYLSDTNSFSDKLLNKDQSVAGFFHKTGRVRAIKLRGEKSCGYLIPVKALEEYYGKFEQPIPEYFDTIGDVLFVEKYQVFVPESNNKSRQGKTPRISRLVPGQVHLHVDTENLRKNAHKVEPEDLITISYKLHGTSFWFSNVLVNRKLKWYDKVLRLLGVKIDDKEYDVVYGSRKVVKNEYETQGKQDYYGYDLWQEIAQEYKDKLPKGYTVYGERVGYTKDGAFIQQGYDYGLEKGQGKNYGYRVTFTNADGFVFDLDTVSAASFCESLGMEFVPIFFHGLAGHLNPNIFDVNFLGEFVPHLESKYNEKDCFMCKNKVPEEGIVLRKEGIVLRKENNFEFEAYKLKSFAFLEYETKMLDQEVVDIESQN